MKTKYFLPIIIFCLTFILSRGSLLATPIDLTTFTAGDGVPEECVVVAPDGSSATLYEDLSIAPISLENTDFYVTLDALSLSFDYALVVPAFNEDYFDFYIDDISAPDFPIGGSENTYSGTYTYGLAALRGQTISIIFDLMYGWEYLAYESSVTISNVNLNPIPEPGTMFLLSIGMFGLIWLRKKKYFST